MTMMPDERAAAIARYRGGYAALVAAMDGVTAAELDAHPIEGEWSIREIVHHVADGELSSAIRLRRLIVEDRPLLLGYDEAQYARVLWYGERRIEPSLASVESTRATTADILDRLDDAGWDRTGIHGEVGEYGVEAWFAIYTEHPYDHADQVRRVRAALAAAHT